MDEQICNPGEPRRRHFNGIDAMENAHNASRSNSHQRFKEIASNEAFLIDVSATSEGCQVIKAKDKMILIHALSLFIMSHPVLSSP